MFKYYEGKHVPSNNEKVLLFEDEEVNIAQDFSDYVELKHNELFLKNKEDFNVLKSKLIDLWNHHKKNEVVYLPFAINKISEKFTGIPALSLELLERFSESARIEFLENKIIEIDSKKSKLNTKFIEIGRRNQSISPLLFNRLCGSKGVAVITAEKNCAYGDLTLEIDDKYKAGLTVNQEVYLTIGNYSFEIFSKEDFDLSKELESNKSATTAELRVLRNKKIAREKEKQRKKFHKELELPFDYTVDIKIVLSGLLENSNGDGAKRNSVNHLVLGEDIKIGKLLRKKGDYLCSQPKGKVSDINNYNLDEKIKDENKEIIDCKNCLDKIERIILVLRKEKDFIKTIHQKIQNNEVVPPSEYSKIDLESESFKSLDTEVQTTITDYINEQSDKIVNAALEEEKLKQERNSSIAPSA